MVGARLPLMNPVRSGPQDIPYGSLISSSALGRGKAYSREHSLCQKSVRGSVPADCGTFPTSHVRCTSQLSRTESGKCAGVAENSGRLSLLPPGHCRVGLSRKDVSGAKWRSEALRILRKDGVRMRKWQCSSSPSSTSPASSAESDVDEPDTDAPQAVQTPTAFIYEADATLTPRPAGQVGFATFSGGSDSTPVVDDKLKPNAWWLLGPILLVTSIVIPHIIVPYVLELVFDNVIITDFLAYFLMDAFFLAGAAYFLKTADSFERHRRAALGQVAVWQQPWQAGSVVAGIRGWARFITAASFGLPLVSMVLVWSFGTGPASLAALGPYLCGLVVQRVAETRIMKSGTPIWPMVPILATVYRLHQLNRGSQLVLELLDSISVPDPSREVLAAAGSLEAVLRVLNILGILWLCNLAVVVFILPALYSKWNGSPKPPERPPVWVPEAASSS